MTLNDDQFREWKDDYDPSREMRVPRSRYYGLIQQSRDFGIEHIDRMNLPDVISEGVAYAHHWGKYGNIPIDNLMAQHHINRDNARRVFRSIKSRGYDEEHPITVMRFGDDSGGVIMDGHHRAVAARASGMREIPAFMIQDEDVDRGIQRYLEQE